MEALADVAFLFRVFYLILRGVLLEGLILDAFRVAPFFCSKKGCIHKITLLEIFQNRFFSKYL